MEKIVIGCSCDYFLYFPFGYCFLRRTKLFSDAGFNFDKNELIVIGCDNVQLSVACFKVAVNDAVAVFFQVFGCEVFSVFTECLLVASLD